MSGSKRFAVGSLFLLAALVAVGGVRRSYGDNGNGNCNCNCSSQGDQAGVLLFSRNDVSVGAHEGITVGSVDVSAYKTVRLMVQSSSTATAQAVIFPYVKRGNVTCLLSDTSGYQTFYVNPVPADLANLNPGGDSSTHVYDAVGGTFTIKAGAYEYLDPAGTATFSVVLVGYTK